MIRSDTMVLPLEESRHTVISPLEKPATILPTNSEDITMCKVETAELMMGLMVQSLPFDYVFVQDLEGRYLYNGNDESNNNDRFEQLGFTRYFRGGGLDAESEAQLESLCQRALANAGSNNNHRNQQCVPVTFPKDGSSGLWDVTLFPIQENGRAVAVGGLIQIVRFSEGVSLTEESKMEVETEPEVATLSKVLSSASLAGLLKEHELSTCCDAHQQLIIEEAFRESEERHQTLFENMKQGVVYHDVDGSTLCANQSALSILNLTMDQMLGKTPMHPQWKFVYENGEAIPVAEYPAVVALSGKPVTKMVLGVCRGENDVHWVQLDAMPRFRPGEDKPYQAYTIFTDITEMKQGEQNLLRAKEKAEEADLLKSAFLATMSHEVCIQSSCPLVVYATIVSHSL